MELPTEMMGNFKNKNIFITGIGTDVGKTIVSAVFVQAFGMDYWKPVQAGNLENSDSITVRNLIDRRDVKIHDEYIRLHNPVSPHAASKYEGKIIATDDILLPETDRGLIIEGAGGVLVPINDRECMIDLIEKCNAKVIIVSKHYLGSINHSLLTFEALQSRNMDVLGWIFNGKPDNETEEIILKKSGKPKLCSILPEEMVSPQIVKKYSKEIKKHVHLF